MSGERRLVFWGGGLLAVLVLLAAGAERVAPADPIRPFDPVAGRHLDPGSRRIEVLLADGSSLLAERAEATAAGVELERLGERRSLKPSELATPVPAHAIRERRFLLGTDRFGRDLASRLLYGARTSLAIATVATGLALVLGLLVGGVAGIAGGAADGLLMRFTDALLAFPNLLLAIALASLFDSFQKAAASCPICGRNA